MWSLATPSVFFSQFGNSNFAYASVDEEELQQQIKEQNENIKALESEIAEYQALADKTTAQAKTLANNISQLEAQAKKLTVQIALTQKKIALTGNEIIVTGNNIVDTEQNISVKRQALAETIRNIDEEDAGNKLANLVSGVFASKRIDSLFQSTFLAGAVRENVSSLINLKTNLEDKKQSSIKQKADLEKLKSSLDDQTKLVDQNKKDKGQLLSETKNQEAEYQKILAEKLEKKKVFEKQLFEYESQLKYNLVPNSLPTQGSLSFPLDKVIITQQFGVTNASARLYVSGSHNGTDFGVPLGTPVKSAGNGTVVGTGDTDLACKRASFGKWVLITYDNGLSTIYGHLSVISSTPGQKVKTGDVVGYSGNTGYSTGPHLHVSMYAPNGVTVQNVPSKSCAGKVFTMPIAATNAYLDPMFYFPKI